MTDQGCSLTYESALDNVDVTALLNSYARGDREAGEQVIRAVYPELRRIARSMMRRISPGHSLDTSALVHEAYLKLHGREMGYQDRVHFLSLSARAMRQILIDDARRQNSLRRGGDSVTLSLTDLDSAGAGLRVSAGLSAESASLLSIDAGLSELEKIDPRLVRVVECRFFAGMSEKEISDALTLSISTVQRSWVKARAWLQDALGTPES